MLCDRPGPIVEILFVDVRNLGVGEVTVAGEVDLLFLELNDCGLIAHGGETPRVPLVLLTHGWEIVHALGDLLRNFGDLLGFLGDALCALTS